MLNLADEGLSDIDQIPIEISIKTPDQSNETQTRTKRNTNYKDNENDVLNDKVGIFRLNGVYPSGLICPFNQQLINFNTITLVNQVLTICLTENRFVIGRIYEADPNNFYNSTVYWSFLTEYRDYGFKQVDFFVKDQQIYFVIAKFGIGKLNFKFNIYLF